MATTATKKPAGMKGGIRRFCSAAEYAEATGRSTWVVHWELRTGRLRGRDLNAGTGKKARWRVFASELRRRDGATNPGPSGRAVSHSPNQRS